LIQYQELSAASKHDPDKLTKITPSKRTTVKEHDDKKLDRQLPSSKNMKMKMRNVKIEKSGV
jgi:hypothetical protein